MAEVTRIPTKFGMGHTDSIAFFQDVVMPALIANKIACFAVRGVMDNGDEIHFTMLDMDADRQWNLRLLGQAAELQHEIVNRLAKT